MMSFRTGVPTRTSGVFWGGMPPGPPPFSRAQPVRMPPADRVNSPRPRATSLCMKILERRMQNGTDQSVRILVYAPAHVKFNQGPDTLELKGFGPAHVDLENLAVTHATGAGRPHNPFGNILGAVVADPDVDFDLGEKSHAV